MRRRGRGMKTVRYALEWRPGEAGQWRPVPGGEAASKLGAYRLFDAVSWAAGLRTEGFWGRSPKGIEVRVLDRRTSEQTDYEEAQLEKLSSMGEAKESFDLTRVLTSLGVPPPPSPQTPN